MQMRTALAHLSVARTRTLCKRKKMPTRLVLIGFCRTGCHIDKTVTIALRLFVEPLNLILANMAVHVDAARDPCTNTHKQCNGVIVVCI